MGPDAMILVFWMLIFKPDFSLSSFTLFKRLSSFSPLPLGWYHLHIWGCWYFFQQSWFQLVIQPAWHFTRCTLHRSLISRVTIYSLVIILSQFWTSPLFHDQFYCFLTCIQVSQEAGEVVWHSHLFKNFPHFLVIHRVKGFHVVSEVEVAVFLEFSWFFCDPADVGNLISGSSVFSKSSLNIWKFSVHILSKPNFQGFELACEISAILL